MVEVTVQFLQLCLQRVRLGDMNTVREPDTAYKGKDGKVLFKWVPAVSKTSLRAEWIKNVQRLGNLPQGKKFSICWQHLTNLASQIKSIKLKTTMCQQFSNSRRKRQHE